MVTKVLKKIVINKIKIKEEKLFISPKKIRKFFFNIITLHKNYFINKVQNRFLFFFYL